MFTVARAYVTAIWSGATRETSRTIVVTGLAIGLVLIGMYVGAFFDLVTSRSALASPGRGFVVLAGLGRGQLSPQDGRRQHGGPCGFKRGGSGQPLAFLSVG